MLRGEAEKHREHSFSQETSKGIFDGPLHYGIRSIRSERYRYIRNFTPEIAFQNTTTNRQPFLSWVKADEKAAKLVQHFQHRPAEEFYDCEADPWNRKNLIAVKSLAPVIADLRQRLDAR